MTLVLPTQRRVALLLIGALTGLLIAGADLVIEWSSSTDKLPPGAIARVGSQIITQVEFERVAQDLATDKRTQEDADRHFALQRVIEEELLVQRGVELGLPETAPAIRKSLAAAVISQIVTEAEASAPSDNELRKFYASDGNFFTQSERWQVRWLRADQTDTPFEIGRAKASSCNFENLTETMSFGVVTEMPRQPLPLAKLMDYMGPTLARQVTTLQPGECTRPILNNNVYNVLFLDAYQPSQLPAFADIKVLIEAEYIRRRGEQALLDYLRWLRNRAEIIVDDAKLD